MGKFRQRRKRLLAPGENLSEVPLVEIWVAVRYAFWWLCSALFRLWQLNPFSVVVRRQRRLYYYDSRGELAIRPPWSEQIADLFRSDETRKAKLLHWVQDMLPRVPIEDFTVSWQDGVALCSLLEEVCTGLCPRPDLLKPHHRVNNCRLGIKLAQKYLRLPKMMITAEEMAIADSFSEMKIVHLLQLLKWRYQRGVSNIPPSPLSQTAMAKIPVAVKVVARGTGLKAGIVGRRAKFNIFTDSVSHLDIHIEIQGPKNELNSERIISISQGLDRRHVRTAAGYPAGSDEDGKSKFIEDDVGNVFLRQKSIDEDQHQNVIPFDYQCVGEGRFLVTYIPRSAGPHFISIKSQDIDIEGSPFEVKVSDWMSSWNVLPKQRIVSFDMLPCIEEAPSQKGESSSPTPDSDFKDSERGSSVSRSRAYPPKQAHVTKKRVVKRVITRNGEEILLTPSPTLSRQSSADVSDMSEDDQVGKKTQTGDNSKSDSSHQTGDIISVKHGEKKDDNVKSKDCNIQLSMTKCEPVPEGEGHSNKSEAVTLITGTKSTAGSVHMSHHQDQEQVRQESHELVRVVISNTSTDNATPSPPKGRCGLWEMRDRGTANNRDQRGTLTPLSRTSGQCQTLFPYTVPHTPSPTISDDPSPTNLSDVMDLDLSPHLRNLSPDLRDLSPNSNEQDGGTRDKNWRRFEETVAQRDQDANDSLDTCSQLVSALTELRPTSPGLKKTVGRSYSEGAPLAPMHQRHFIRMRRLDGQGGDCCWSSMSSDPDTASHHSTDSNISSRKSLKSKVLQSDSLKKTCIYINDSTLTHSLSLNSSSSDFPPLTSPSSGLSPILNVASPASGASPDPMTTLDSQQTEDGRFQTTLRRDRMFSSKTQWKTFHGDIMRQFPDEFETRNKERQDCFRKRSQSLVAPTSCYDDQINCPGLKPYDYQESAELENLSIMDKLNDDDEILEVVIESTDFPEQSETAHAVPRPKDRSESFSEDSSSSTSLEHHFQKNLSRPGTAKQTTPSEVSPEGASSRSQSSKLGTSPEDTTNSKVFRTIQKERPPIKKNKSIPVSIVVPIAKTDRSTQVSYDEIKAETGWKRPLARVVKRKKYVREEQVLLKSTPSSEANLPAQGKDDSSNNIQNKQKPKVHDLKVPNQGSLLIADEQITAKSASKCNSHQQADKVIGSWRSEGSNGRVHDWLQQNVLQKEASSKRRNNGIEFEASRISTDTNSSGKTKSVGKGESVGSKPNIHLHSIDKESNKCTTINSVNTLKEKENESISLNSKKDNTPLKVLENKSSELNGKIFESNNKISSDQSHARLGRTQSEPCITEEEVINMDTGDFDGGTINSTTIQKPQNETAHIVNWIQHIQHVNGVDSHRTERQSTVDTLDSGIENDSQSILHYGSPKYQTYINGHRRLQRRPYPWAIELDPSLIHGSNTSLAPEDTFCNHDCLRREAYPWQIELDAGHIRSRNSSSSTEGIQDNRFKLTMGVIEAAVHRTVQKLLSGSSSSSSCLRQRLSHRAVLGESSLSDSELNYSETVSQKRKRAMRKMRKQKNVLLQEKKDGSSCNSSTIFPNNSSLKLLRTLSPDVIMETKSDGRYSPYSATDIPCFELPSAVANISRGAKQKFKYIAQKVTSHLTKDSNHRARVQDRHFGTKRQTQHYSQPHWLSPSQLQITVTQEDKTATEMSPILNGSEKKPVTPIKVTLPARQEHCNGHFGVNACKSKCAGQSCCHHNSNTRTDSGGLSQKAETSSKSPTSVVTKGESSRNQNQRLSPKIIVNRSPKRHHSSTSIDDSYFGFGISRAQRKDMVLRLEDFQTLASEQHVSNSSGPPSTTSPNQLKDILEDFLMQYNDPFDDNSLISPVSTFADFFYDMDLENCAQSESDQNSWGESTDEGKGTFHVNTETKECFENYAELSVSPLQGRVACVQSVQVQNHSKTGSAGGPVKSSKERNGDYESGDCLAFGAGLSYGLVGAPNSFQVWTERPIRGCVTVAVYGPRSQCVTEINVTYIGDNIYDVTYNVTSPGYYIIVVKLGDRSMPDSPYFCRVTY